MHGLLTKYDLKKTGKRGTLQCYAGRRSNPDNRRRTKGFRKLAETMKKGFYIVWIFISIFQPNRKISTNRFSTTYVDVYAFWGH